MRWDLATDANPELQWMRRLVALHQQHRALRVGDFRLLVSDKLLAYERYTDRIADAVFVVANPSREPVSEWVLVPDSKLMNDVSVVDLLDPSAPPVGIHSALLQFTLAPGEVRVLAPDVAAKAGYTPYKRVQ